MSEIKNLKGKIDIRFPEYTEEDFRRAEEYERAKLEKRINKTFMKCGASKKDLTDAGFEKYINSSAWQQDAFKTQCFEYYNEICRDETNRTMMIYGKPGTGKTYHALSILKLWCHTAKQPIYIIREKIDENGNTIKVKEDCGIVTYHSGKYITTEDLCECFRGKDTYDKSLLKDVLKSCELLIIDEVGRSAIKAEYEREYVFTILNKRFSNYLPTILISNMNQAELNKHLGNALWSRITSNGIPFCTDELPNMRSQKARSYQTVNVIKPDIKEEEALF